MKKKIILTIGAMSAAAILGLGFAQSVTVSAGPDLSQEEIKEKVQKQYPGKITELELDEEGKVPIYAIEIEINGKEYELDIDGNSGEVLKLDEKLVQKEKSGTMSINRFTNAEVADLKIKEKSEEKQTTSITTVQAPKQEEKVVSEPPKQKETPVSEPVKPAQKTASVQESKSKPEQAPKQEQKAQAQQPKQEQKPAVQEPKKEAKPAKKAIITRDKAIQIALAQFSGKVEDVELDDDDGRLVYEVEIESERGEADIEIDAYTGKVLVVDVDLDDD